MARKESSQNIAELSVTQLIISLFEPLTTY